MVVKTTPKLASAIEARAAAIAAEQGFDGRVQIVADPKLTGADCRLEWRGGGLERAHSVIDAALADLIARRFASANKTSEVEE